MRKIIAIQKPQKGTEELIALIEAYLKEIEECLAHIKKLLVFVSGIIDKKPKPRSYRVRVLRNCRSRQSTKFVPLRNTTKPNPHKEKPPICELVDNLLKMIKGMLDDCSRRMKPLWEILMEDVPFQLSKKRNKNNLAAYRKKCAIIIDA